MDYGQPATLEFERRPDGVLEVWLARPDKHNAFNEAVIDELCAAFEVAGADDAVRCVVLGGRGKSFSAGADISWMRAPGDVGYADNLDGALRMARMFQTIYECPKPVLARVHGAALGGGTGLTAVVDIAYAAESAIFGFTEVRLGIVPAVISPYVVDKLGAAKARALFLTGERFDAREAERVGLVFRSVPDDALDGAIDGGVQAVLKGGPAALGIAKNLSQRLAAIDDIGHTAELIAHVRGSDEAREGLTAFLEKRKAAWCEECDD